MSNRHPKYRFIEITIVVLAALTYFYFKIPILSEQLDKLFLTTSTFLFAIFTGFFIQRQGLRYTTLRDKLNSFDGEISCVYRNLEYFGKDVQEKFANIIRPYYERMAVGGGADVVFGPKSNIMRDTHAMLRENLSGKYESLNNAVLSNIQSALHNGQLIRKSYIALREERVPLAQWLLIGITAVVLIVTISVTIPSVGFLVGALLKAAFVVAVLFVLILLYQLDTLKLFESAVGQSSASDVLAIIKGSSQESVKN